MEKVCFLTMMCDYDSMIDYMTSYHHHYDQEEAKAQPELLVPRAVGVPQDPQRLYDYMIMILLLTNVN